MSMSASLHAHDGLSVSVDFIPADERTAGCGDLHIVRLRSGGCDLSIFADPADIAAAGLALLAYARRHGAVPREVA